MSITGPKKRPIVDVPERCTKKTAVMITNTIGTTGVCGFNERSPSTAEVTVIAGVIMPSARRALAPIAATIKGQRLERGRLINENRAMMPPSPLLSARNAPTTYFIVVWSVRVQITHETAPNI